MVWLFLVLFAGQFETTFHDGLIALNENNLALAEAHLEKAAELQPQNARVWLALAQTYWKLHKEPLAQSVARKAETLGTNDTLVLRSLSIFHTQIAHYPRAPPP